MNFLLVMTINFLNSHLQNVVAILMEQLMVTHAIKIQESVFVNQTGWELIVKHKVILIYNES